MKKDNKMRIIFTLNKIQKGNYLRSDAKRFLGLTIIRSILAVLRLELLDVCMSSSAEKNASDGFSDVSEIVRCT